MGRRPSMLLPSASTGSIHHPAGSEHPCRQATPTTVGDPDKATARPPASRSSHHGPTRTTPPPAPSRDPRIGSSSWACGPVNGGRVDGDELQVIIEDLASPTREALYSILPVPRRRTPCPAARCSSLTMPASSSSADVASSLLVACLQFGCALSYGSVAIRDEMQLFFFGGARCGLAIVDLQFFSVRSQRIAKHCGAVRRPWTCTSFWGAVRSSWTCTSFACGSTSYFVEFADTFFMCCLPIS